MQTVPTTHVSHPYSSAPVRDERRNGSEVKRENPPTPQATTSSTNTTDLRRVLRLIGRSIGAECAYVLVAPPLKAQSDEPRDEPEHWLRVAWHLSGPQEEIDVPEIAASVERFLDASHESVASSVFKGGDEASQIVIPLFAAQKTAGYLGIQFRSDVTARPDAHTLRLVQEIVAGYLRQSHASEILWEDDKYWQATVAAYVEPTLVLVQGRVTHCNYAAAQLLGGPHARSVIGRSLHDFVSAEDWSILLTHFGALGRGDDVQPLAYPLIRLDGYEHLVEAHCKPVQCQGSPAFRITFCKVNRYPRYSDLLIDTISEGIWHVALRNPVDVSEDAAAQSRKIRRNGYLVECNRVLARFFGLESSDRLLGVRVASLLTKTGRTIIRKFVESGYELQGYEYCVRDDVDSIRLFKVNATGSVEDGHLTHIWGSCTEITDRVEMERKTVILQEEQQERIGRDLHDSVAPFLTGLRLLSGDLISDGAEDTRTLEAKARKIADYAEAATKQLRTIYRGLVPRDLEESSLGTALREFADSVDMLPGSLVKYYGDDRVDGIGQHSKIQLYRIAQEAVNNALKHAKAEVIRINLKQENGHIRLEVQDDGAGFDNKIHHKKSLGLDNMRRRAHSIGATLSIASEPGTGTTIQCVLPYR